jgi:hypothetical protein
MQLLLRTVTDRNVLLALDSVRGEHAMTRFADVLAAGLSVFGTPDGWPDEWVPAFTADVKRRYRHARRDLRLRTRRDKETLWRICEQMATDGWLKRSFDDETPKSKPKPLTQETQQELPLG